MASYRPSFVFARLHGRLSAALVLLLRDFADVFFFAALDVMLVAPDVAVVPNACIDSLATRPSTSNCTPSATSRSRFRSTEGAESPQLPLKPPSQRVDAMTRCQGTGFSHPELGASGLCRIAWPTARAQDCSAAATPPYVATLPRGILRTSSKQRCWKGVSFDMTTPVSGPSLAIQQPCSGARPSAPRHFRRSRSVAATRARRRSRPLARASACLHATTEQKCTVP